MNAMVLLVIALCVFALAYRFYGVFLATKVLVLDPGRKVPSHTMNDGHDYMPTNKWVLFGHHFAAIAGAGPLIGPVLAAQFGYLPGLMWILIGCVLGGAVHDYVILFASVRHKGTSLHQIGRDYVGKITGTATAAAVLFIIITALAGLSIAVVNALSSSPWGTFTIASTIPTALFIGVYMNKLRKDKIVEATIIGVVLLLLGVIFGNFVQSSDFSRFFTFDKKQLSVILAIYGFLASVLPVWLLLVPRDYLSTYLKIGTISLLAIGIVFVMPKIQMPAMTQFCSGGGPIIPGKVFPYVFITIACGAISGFHALISSGTTPKMINNEKDILPIGFGAMLVEGFVSIMALIAATALIPSDYFAINCSPEVFAKLGMVPGKLSELSMMVNENVAGRPGGAVSLAVGMAYIFSGIPGMKSLMGYWYHFIIMFEALFIMTTIDAGTRVARYILQDVAGTVVKPFKDKDWMPGTLITSGVIVFAWGYLVYNGDIASIWPMFGVANQLLATAALAIGTSIIMKHNKYKAYGLITFIPMLFMLVVTLTAGFENIFGSYLKLRSFNGNLNAVLTGLMIVLVSIIVIDCSVKWVQYIKKNGWVKEPEKNPGTEDIG